MCSGTGKTLKCAGPEKGLRNTDIAAALRESEKEGFLYTAHTQQVHPGHSLHLEHVSTCKHEYVCMFLYTSVRAKPKHTLPSPANSLKQASSCFCVSEIVSLREI